MLKSHERLHKIELDSMSTRLLNKAMGPRSNLTHAVTYNIPFNCAC